MIPEWTINNVIPAIRPNAEGHSTDRSPYEVSVIDLVERFATSPERIEILEGYLNYRKALHDLGLLEGFQWLDGSFCENVELIEERAPRDIDVVTYYYMPEEESQSSLFEKNPDVFINPMAKQIYKVDAYFTQLGLLADKLYIKSVAYWYSMWSHNRSNQWKGYLQITLSPEFDDAAIEKLTEISSSGGES